MGHDIDFSAHAVDRDRGRQRPRRHRLFGLLARGRDFDAITPHAPSLLNISIREDLGGLDLSPFLAAGLRLHPHPLDPMDKRRHHRLFVGTSKVNRWMGAPINDASAQGKGA